MRARSLPVTLAVALCVTLLAPLSASAAHVDGLRPVVDELFISAGCPSDGTTPTCTSTRWLGKTPGDANTNWLTATTPVDEVFDVAGEEPNWRDYASDDSLPAGGYVVNADDPLEVRVTVISRVLAAKETVHARVQLDLGRFTFVDLPEQEITFTLISPGTSETAEFEFDLPDDLHGETVQALTVEIAVHGINAQGGYINQSGESTVRIPHFVE